MKIKLLFFLLLCSVTQSTKPIIKEMSKGDMLLAQALSGLVLWSGVKVVDLCLNKFQSCCTKKAHKINELLKKEHCSDAVCCELKSRKSNFNIIWTLLGIPRIVTVSGRYILPIKTVLSMAAILSLKDGSILIWK